MGATTESAASCRLFRRHALVTGASTGIGRAVAIRFAREGATVAINYFGSKAEAEEVLADAHAASTAVGRPDAAHRIVRADVSDEVAVRRMIEGMVSD